MKQKITESTSLYDNLEQMSTLEVLHNINTEDRKVAIAVEEVIPSILKFIDHTVERMKTGGRLFYIGAGTSGRLGVLDASECPPTFGVDQNVVVGVIAGGDLAIRNSVESAEDNVLQAWKDLQTFDINEKDTVLGIAASGSTPYVLYGLTACREKGISTGCITCNPNSPLAWEADFPIEVITGPEFLTGSTRMKAGTAQKMVLNMISTSIMIQLGHVKGNKMVDMKLNNNKLVERGRNMLVEQLNIPSETAQALLNKYGSVRKVIENYVNI